MYSIFCTDWKKFFSQLFNLVFVSVSDIPVNFPNAARLLDREVRLWSVINAETEEMYTFAQIDGAHSVIISFVSGVAWQLCKASNIYK